MFKKLIGVEAKKSKGPFALQKEAYFGVLSDHIFLYGVKS